MISGSYVCNTYDTHIWVSYTCYDTLYDCHIRVTHVQTHMWHTYMCIIWSNLQILFVHMCESYMIHIYDYDLTCLIWLSHIWFTHMSICITYIWYTYMTHTYEYLRYTYMIHTYDAHILYTYMIHLYMSNVLVLIYHINIHVLLLSIHIKCIY